MTLNSPPQQAAWISEGAPVVLLGRHKIPTKQQPIKERSISDASALSWMTNHSDDESSSDSSDGKQAVEICATIPEQKESVVSTSTTVVEAPAAALVDKVVTDDEDDVTVSESRIATEFSDTKDSKSISSEEEKISSDGSLSSNEDDVQLMDTSATASTTLQPDPILINPDTNAIGSSQVSVIVSPLSQGGRFSRGMPAIKCYNFDDIPITNKSKVWKQLPKPDMQILKSLSAPQVTTRCETSSATRYGGLRRTVTFGVIAVRNYDQCLGDNPSVGYGPPLSLDWEYEEVDPISLDSYEAVRGPRRKPRQMMLNYYQRMNLLQFRFGVSETEIKSAVKEVKKEKRSRAITKYFLPISKAEEIVESVGRKSRRLVRKAH